MEVRHQAPLERQVIDERECPGIGVGQSLVKADKWLALAEARSEGDVKGEAARLRTEIEALMTTEEIGRARANAQSWRPVVASGSD